MFDVELEICSWKDRLREKGNFKETDILELENHLRDEIEVLTQSGLSVDEAFLIGIKRLGNVDSISREFSKVNTDQLWKQLLLDPATPEAGKQNRREIRLIILLAIIAGTLAKIPELFGIPIMGKNDLNLLFYFKNVSFFILPLLAFYFAWKKNYARKYTILALAVYVISFFLINMYPVSEISQTTILSVVHLPLFLWLITGFAYVAPDWKNTSKRMDFIRFSGETLIYSGLIGCGVIVLIGFTQIIFSAIKVDLHEFIIKYLMVYGGAAVPIVAVYLVEAKKSIVENLAPVLAKIFSPLFLLIMLAFLAIMLISGKSPFVEREFLIGFDVMLVMVLGLVLYVISARDIHESPRFFDYLNLSLIIVASIIDLIALSAILFRLSAYGISPNKIAALGENLVLLFNLGGLAILYIRYFTKQIDFSKLEKWQTSYLGIYAGWFAVVSFLFPIIFRFK